ncbi:MAG TPA: LLM class flavin-dependent oxidoreductase [Acidimicrobiales bacterium]|nr:LLM class flavin-dependent oxidoreductase [Acidimicrobiales bacterium]
MTTRPPEVRLALALTDDRPLAETIELARLAEELGFAEIWTNETGHYRGAFTLAAAISTATSSAGIGIGIVNPFHRHPSVIAMEAATLDELSGGRLRLGIGAALWNLRDLGEADSRTRRPLTATIEAVRIVQALLRGEPGIESKIYTVSPEAHLDFTPVRPNLPVYVGAVNERMLRAGGAWADAVELGAITSGPYVRWALEAIAEGASSNGRDSQYMDIAAPLMVSIAEDHRSAREAVREQLAYYLFRVEPVMTSVSGADPQAVATVRREVRDHGVAAGARLVGDELIDTFAIAGDPAHVAKRFAEYAAAGVKGLIAQNVANPDRVGALRLLAEAVLPEIAGAHVG